MAAQRYDTDWQVREGMRGRSPEPHGEVGSHVPDCTAELAGSTGPSQGLEGNGTACPPQRDVAVNSPVSSEDSAPTLKRLKRKSENRKLDRQFRQLVSSAPEYKRQRDNEEASEALAVHPRPAQVFVDTKDIMTVSHQKDV